jgi:hypothetical protein
MSRASPLLVALAVAGPALVSVGVVRGLESHEQSLTQEQRERTRKTGPAALDYRLAHTEPAVVALGNSVTAADLDEELLGQLLNVPGQVVAATSPGSLAPTWFLVLENRVYGNGHRPSEVMVINPLENLLEVQPASELEFDRLTRHMKGPEPALKKRMGAAHPLSAWAWQLRARRARAREDVVHAARDGFVGLVLGAPDIDGAFETVFDQPAAVEDHVRVLPVIELDRVRDTHAPDDSFLVDLFDLTDAHGSTLTIVVPPTLDPGAGVDTATQAAVQSYVAERGGRYVDLSQGYEPALFKDAYHLDTPGAKRFTRQLASAILGEDVPEGRPERTGKGAATKEGPRPPATMPEDEALVMPVAFVRTAPEAPPTWTAPESAEPCRWVAETRPRPGASWARATNAPFTVSVGDRPLTLVSEDVEPCSDSWRVAPAGLRFGAEGDPPALALAWQPAPPLEASVGNTEVWVLPGTTATWSFDGSGPEEVVVFLRGKRWGPDDGTLSLSFDGEPVEPTWSRAGDVFRRIRKQPVEGPWELVIGVAEGGSPVLVTRVTVAEKGVADAP